jgi:hypothetical protein
LSPRQADDVIRDTVRYTLNISKALNNKLIEYYSERFLEKQRPQHLYILNSLGGDGVAEISGILKLISIAEQLSIYDKDSFSKVFIKTNEMLPLARAFNEKNPVYPQD